MLREYVHNDRHHRRWERISWWYSLILVVPILGFIITFAWPSDEGVPGLSGVVTDAYTGKPVSDAIVSTVNATATTNSDGRFTIPDLTATSLNVARDDYESAQVTVSTVDERVEIDLRPTTIRGVVRNERNNKPVSGATVSATGTDGTTITAVTNDEGEYVLEDVPDGAVISVTYDGLALASQPVGREAEIDFKIRADALTGTITDESGQPIAGAKVAIGTATAMSGDDGMYRVVGVPESGVVSIRKAGYVDATAEIPDSMKLDATLEGSQVHALYAPPEVLADDQRWLELLDVADRTVVNAVVLDLKNGSGHVLYDSQVPLVSQVGAEMPTYDLPERIGELKDHNLYVIGRISVFQDPALAEARPDLAIVDVTSGELWRTWDGLAWVNPYQRDVWTYNVDLAVEAAELGVDEIQLDHVRFPSDGILDSAGFGDAFATTPMVDAVTGFLGEMKNGLESTDTFLAVDVTGLSVWAEDDGNVGEDFVAIASLVDVISPRLFPSHFYPGTLGFDIPNDHPYDVVLQSLQMAAARIPDAQSKVRPWLQDFSYGEGIAYGPTEVAAQIRAAEEFGANGWMVWNPEGRYSLAALAAE